MNYYTLLTVRGRNIRIRINGGSRMKFIKYLLCCTLLLIGGCSSSPKTESKKLNILCPSGAPSLALTSIYGDHNVTIVEGTDLLIAELSKKDSEYDLIIAPINLGGKLIATNQTDYRLDSIITWGNLYLVGTSQEALNEQGEIALFGQGAVPEKIYNAANVDTTLTPNYYNAGNYVQTQLLSGQNKVGLLAEPLATATIAKAKSEGIELQVLMDLQQAYADAKGTEYGYPQAAIFAKDSKTVEEVTKTIQEYCDGGFSGIDGYLDTIGVDTLKLPSKEITIKSLDKQNINYKKAKDVTNDITTFLKEFNIDFDNSMLLNE